MFIESREKILDAAAKVVAHEKLSGTRMHMIAEEAEMSSANLHYHFPTKNDIIMALIDNIQKQFSSRRLSYVDFQNKTIFENICDFFDQKKDEILNSKESEVIQLDYIVQGTADEKINTKVKESFGKWRDEIKMIFDNSCENPIDFKAKFIGMMPTIMISLMLGASIQYLIDDSTFDLKEYFYIVEKILSDQL